MFGDIVEGIYILLLIFLITFVFDCLIGCCLRRVSSFLLDFREKRPNYWPSYVFSVNSARLLLFLILLDVLSNHLYQVKLV